MTAPSTIRISFPEPDIALLTFDDPEKGANILSRGVMDELSSHLDALEKRTDLAGLIFASAKPGVFIAGADIREFIAAGSQSRTDTVAMASRGRQIFQRIGKLPFPSVAAINGICVGGGAELAVWCDRRLMSADARTQIGFPEVKLGIYPGWGGTVRTPRITGAGNAVELITGGESISGQAAVRMGLATDTVSAERLLEAAIGVIRAELQSGDYLRDRERWGRPMSINPTEHAFLGATAGAYIQQQTKGQYPAPVAALQLMLTTMGLDAEAACQKEVEGFVELFGSPVSRALINVFFLTDRNKKDTGISDRSVTPAEVRSVGVVGAGIMGSGIAAACLKRSLSVVLTDARSEQLTSGARNAVEDAAFDKTLRGPSAEKLLKLAPLLREVTNISEFSQCDLVIEAIVENEAVKRELHTRMESQLSDKAILASNTSAISIGRLAEGLKRPERFCGIHFFNPVRRMSLVEVIRGPQTSDETVSTAVAFAKGLGKNPIVVADGPGFLVNRLLFPYMNETVELLASGLPVKAVEGAAREFGMPMGPVTLYDVVGLDTALFAGQVMMDAFPDRFLSSPLLAALVEAGRLGQKSGAGFFAYRDKSGRGEQDPAFDAILAAHRKPASQSLDGETVILRLFLPMLLEATRVLEEKKVRDPRDVDLGLIFGIGFPPFKGGLLHWADTIGTKRIVEILKPFESLGERYRATPLLLELAASARGFYDLTRKTS
jgi:3-hydroxyacyl-CoA dehydrogenase/enoyl-CoA hydratase/carnithine racemase